jgi:F-type H+-transporting ATPase subunit beta
MAENIGRVVQVSGPAVDVQFEEATMPPIYQALRVVDEGFKVPFPINVILEVEQHLGEGRVRTVAMKPTEGVVRGMKTYRSGRTDLPCPSAAATLGRVMNVLGEPVDNLGPVKYAKATQSHSSHPAPSLRRSIHES